MAQTECRNQHWLVQQSMHTLQLTATIHGVVLPTACFASAKPVCCGLTCLMQTYGYAEDGLSGVAEVLPFWWLNAEQARRCMCAPLSASLTMGTATSFQLRDTSNSTSLLACTGNARGEAAARDLVIWAA